MLVLNNNKQINIKLKVSLLTIVFINKRDIILILKNNVYFKNIVNNQMFNDFIIILSYKFYNLTNFTIKQSLLIK